MHASRDLSPRRRPQAPEQLNDAAPAAASRRALFALLGAAGLAFGVAALIGKAAGYGQLLHSLRSADGAWLAAGLPAEALAYLGYTLAFRATAALDGGPRFRLPRSLRLVVASIGATRLVPGGGPAYLYWALRRSRLGRTGALARIAALNVLLFGLLAAVTWLASLLVVLRPGGPVPRALALPWLIGVAAATGALLAAATLIGLGLATRRATFALEILLRHPGRHLPAYLGATLYWAGDVLCLWIALRAFDARPGFSALVLAYATSYVATMLPLPLGGAGGGEAAIVLSLTAVGLPLAPSLLGVLGYRLFNFWIPTVPGLMLLAHQAGVRVRADKRPHSDSPSGADQRSETAPLPRA